MRHEGATPKSAIGAEPGRFYAGNWASWAPPMKLRRGVRRKGIRWEYNWDGVFARERIKGFWKAYWKRWTRRERKETA